MPTNITNRNNTHPIRSGRRWRRLTGGRVELLNAFFREQIVADDRSVFLGEDILSLMAGAFKVTRELSFLKPERVFSTPISEAAITGISNGLALNGFKPYMEIMSGTL